MKKPTMVKWAALLLFLLAAPMAAFSQSREGSVEVSGGSLFYLSDGSGPAVVLLHGYSKSSSVWEPYFAELGQQHRVFAFDLPGHGRSDSGSATRSNSRHGYLGLHS